MRTVLLVGSYGLGLIALAWLWWTIEMERWPWI